MGILHWWISAGTKIAEGPKRKIIVALAETDGLMKEIDKVEIT